MIAIWIWENKIFHEYEWLKCYCHLKTSRGLHRSWNRRFYYTPSAVGTTGRHLGRHVTRLYCHVSGVPWPIITGSGLDDWIYWRLLYKFSWSQSIIIAHNKWLPKTRSILAGLRLSSLLVFLLLRLTWLWFTNELGLINDDGRITYEWITNDSSRTTECVQSRAEQSSRLLPATSKHSHCWHRAPLGPMAIYNVFVQCQDFCLFLVLLFLLW
jgi:hypothetical protein